jgi:hypothetical protein
VSAALPSRVRTLGAGQDAKPGFRCGICNALAQLALNVAVLLDLALNVGLMGSAHETVSQRAARARRAGSKAAAAFCSVLTALWRLFGYKDDHCTWALETPGSLSQELWSWSPDTPNPPAPPDAR